MTSREASAILCTDNGAFAVTKVPLYNPRLSCYCSNRAVRQHRAVFAIYLQAIRSAILAITPLPYLLRVRMSDCEKALRTLELRTSWKLVLQDVVVGVRMSDCEKALRPSELLTSWKLVLQDVNEIDGVRPAPVAQASSLRRTGDLTSWKLVLQVHGDVLQLQSQQRAV